MATVSWAHLALYPALDHESPMRTDNLELQKARSVLAPIAAPQIAFGKSNTRTLRCTPL
jgi:hypothetical protein